MNLNKYNPKEHYKNSNLEYFSEASLLHHPEIEELCLSNEELLYLNKILVYDYNLNNAEYQLFVRSVFECIFKNFNEETVIALCHSNYSNKSNFKSKKGFLNRKYKHLDLEENLLELEIDLSENNSFFATAIKLTQKNFLSFFNIELDRSFLYLLTKKHDLYFNKNFLRNKYLKFINENSFSEYNLKNLVFKLVDADTSIIQFDNGVNFKSNNVSFFVDRKNEKCFDSLLIEYIT